MPRRREIPKREVLPDPIYNSQLVTKFVNVVMRDGKKSVAERILYDALEAIRQRRIVGTHDKGSGGQRGRLLPGNPLPCDPEFVAVRHVARPFVSLPAGFASTTGPRDTGRLN